MSTTELRALLDQVADTRELVLRRAASLGPAFNAVYDAWSDAHEEAEDALRAWLGSRLRLRLRRVPRRPGPRGRRAGRARRQRLAAHQALEVVRQALRRELVVREADALAALAVDEHDAGRVVELAALRRRRRSPSTRARARASLPSRNVARPVIRRSARKRLARAGVSFAGSTETASSGTSAPVSSSAPRTWSTSAGQVSSQVE